MKTIVNFFNNFIEYRYESTITAQFFGHTHYDEFEVFYDTSDHKRAVSIAYIGPSVTPYQDVNPGYRIYYVDGDHPKTTRMVTDHESWVMDLKDANLYDSPAWFKLYNVRETYKMRSLLPRDWSQLIDVMAEDPNVFDVYYKHYYKNSVVRPACDHECRKRILCDARSGKSHTRKILCEDIEYKINSQIKPMGWGAWLYQGLSMSMSVVLAIPRFALSLPSYVLG